MAQLKELGIDDNTLVILMADNGPMTHDGPPGMVEHIYRGGKGDYWEGALRVPAFARWPGVIESGQIVGDIVHEVGPFHYVRQSRGGQEIYPDRPHRRRHRPDGRAARGRPPTAARDFVFVYTGNILAATVKGRFKRRWEGEKPGLSGAAFYDLYNDPREVQPKMLPGFPAKGMFTIMKVRHLFVGRSVYPDKGQNRDFPFKNIENARPETVAASKPRIPKDRVPFDPREFIKNLPEWDNVDRYWGVGE